MSADAELARLLDAALHEPVLVLDPGLEARLPALTIARRVAARYGALTVLSRRLPPGYLGATAIDRNEPARRAVILLDDRLDDTELATVFAHELAHLLDPFPARGDEPGEAFADELGALLAIVA